MNYVKLVNGKLSVEEISSMVSSPRCGAISLFVGTTRDNFQDQKVLQLEYEAYEPMAIKAMTVICGEVRTKWPSVENIAVYHRLGIVPVKEASVVIAVSSPHRLESLAAVGYTIEALKTSVPIWKKEVYESDKPAEWKENKELISNLSKKMKTEVDGPLDGCPSHSSDHQGLGNISFAPINSKLVQIKADAQEIERRMKRFIDRKREDLNVINNRDFCNQTMVLGEENINSCARVDALLVRRTGSKSHLRRHCHTAAARESSESGNWPTGWSPAHARLPTSTCAALGLGVRRVFNKWGPQTMRGSTVPFDIPSEQPANDVGPPLCQDNVASAWEPRIVEAKPSAEAQQPLAVEERLQNAEQHLKLDGPVPRDVYTRLKKIEARILYLEGISPEYSSFWVTQAGLNSGHHTKTMPKTKKIYTLEDLEAKMNVYRNKMVHK